LRERGFALLDAQVMNPHLASLGAQDIPRVTFLARLRRALTLNVAF
jgi:leucyl/phenylalanyl-tRNA--protein transferase